MTYESMGLRTQKRLETRNAIEDITLKLIGTKGPSSVTVEQIAKAAHLSPRTFFNYFDSKEDAILGFSTHDVEDYVATIAVEQHVVYPVEFLISIYINVFRSTLENPARQKIRLKLLRQYPELLERQLAHMSRVTTCLIPIATEILDGSDAPTIRQQQHSHLHAEILLMTCSGALRAVIKDWVFQNKKLSIEKLEAQAAGLVHEVVERIS